MPTRRDGQWSVPRTRFEAAGEAEDLRRVEWLLTNGMSGFAMGTASGVPSRRYHGLLVSETMHSPDRRVYVNAVEEELVVTDKSGTRVAPLSSFRFRAGDGSDVVHPEGWRSLRAFEKGSVCRWEYEAHGARVVKRLALRRDTRAAVIDYTVTPARGSSAELRVRPLVSLRPFHWLQRRDGHSGQFDAKPGDSSCAVRRTDSAAQLFMSCTGGRFEHEEQWWYNFVWCMDRERGQDCLEDLFSPGEFIFASAPRRARVDTAIQFALEEGVPLLGIDAIEEQDVARKQKSVAAIGSVTAGAPAAPIARLACAADDFVYSRWTVDTDAPVSIIAGYPWFADWGRDSTISLPGLLLLTGRHKEALGVLHRFAAARRAGIVPNRFGDEHGEPLYNSVDASLWFIVACARYAAATGDHAALEPELLPACLDVVEHFRRGTEHTIGMDPHDFLVTAGSPMTQLTWMDALRDGVVFTPRHGKAVEINALWVSALSMLAELTAVSDPVGSADLRALADAAAGNFRIRFWNEERGCCYDTLAPDNGAWHGVPEVRPNQIFAVALPHSPLSPAQAKSVVNVVRERLYTPMGLRTLEPGHPAYRPRFRGSLKELDAAYHNGTAWPWLLGAYAEAIMRVDGFSDASRREARAALEPIIGYLDGWCVGQLPEVFDAEGTPEDPQRPGGCPAQAWSVAEVLRGWVMAEGALT
jgi:predicted glycogen debranching enzyme